MHILLWGMHFCIKNANYREKIQNFLVGKIFNNYSVYGRLLIIYYTEKSMERAI